MLRVSGPAERAFWGLIRACISAGGHLRRVAEGVHEELRPEERQVPAAQRALWVTDAEGLPPRPWRVQPDDVFDCVVLSCKAFPVSECVARQLATDAQRTKQASRGQGTEYPLCDTRKCAQGRGIREALDPTARVTWEGAGPGGRFERERPPNEKAAQNAARARLGRAGLLEEVRTLDVEPDAVEGVGEER